MFCYWFLTVMSLAPVTRVQDVAILMYKVKFKLIAGNIIDLSAYHCLVITYEIQTSLFLGSIP